MTERLSTMTHPWKYKNPGLVKKSSIAHSHNTLRILSKNVQRNTHASHWQSLCDHDVLLLQETNLSTSSAFATSILKDFVWTLPSHITNPSLHKAAVMVRQSKAKVLKINQIHNALSASSRPYIADSLVSLKESSETWLVISAYLPSGAYDEQTQVLRELHMAMGNMLRETQNTYPKCKVLLGGDFNNVLNEYIDCHTYNGHSINAAMQRSRDALERIINDFRLADTFRKLFPSEAHATNRSPNNSSRRLDRFYLSHEVANRLYSFGERKEPFINSTHITICMEILLDLNCPTSLGKRRFCVDENLLSSNLTLAQFERSDPDSTWDETVKENKRIMSRASFSDYSRRRRNLQPLEPHPTPPSESFHTAQKIAFKGSRFQSPIFHTIRSADGSQIGHRTPEILRISQEFWKKQMSAPKSIDPAVTHEFLQKWKCNIPEAAIPELDRPFTSDELFESLSQSENGVPGEDGFTYKFWAATWEHHGPKLTRVANGLMAGNIPKRMSEILITLIPKRSKSDNVADFRPIALSNSSLRIICRAINNRLVATIETLIGSYQKGFLPSRQIDDNIAQFRNLVTILRESGKYNHDSPFSPFAQLTNWSSTKIAMVDFEKAFDSVSHEYIEHVLLHIKLPVGLRTAILTIIRSQHARLWMNRTKSARFPMAVGTMQGNPFSPVLFILAIEPLLAQLDSSLIGASFEHKLGFKCQITLNAYADDLIVYLGDQTDEQTLHSALTQFHAVSNCKVNISKSALFDFNEHDDDEISETLGFPVRNYDSASFKYLGFSNHALTWHTEVCKLVGALHQTAISTLSPIHRAHGINTFLFSKIYFRDLHSPMRTADINALQKRLKTFFPRVDKATIFNRTESGGYGCLDLHHQLLGKRALFVQNAIFDKSNWHLTAFRCKIQFMMTRLHIDTEAQPSSPPGAPMTIRWLAPWFGFLFGYTYPYKSTSSSPSQLGNFLTIPWRRFFTYSEVKCLEAWFQIVMPLYFPAASELPTSPAAFPRGVITHIDQSFSLHYATSGYQLESLPEPLKKAESSSLFQSRSKIAQLVNPDDRLSPVMRSLRSQADFKKFWEQLKTSAMQLNQPLSYLHLFHLGRDIGLYANTSSCPLCQRSFQSDASQTLRTRHIYFECSTSKTIWRASGLSNHPYTRIVIGSVNAASPNIDKFLFYVGRFLRNRRRGEEEAHGLESTGATARLPELSREEIHRNLKYYGQSYGQQF
ncbi:hypothetical protein OY671_000361 [Metschnikowia pulcherrima]|nr:hypothetical protein OY671_000361 [Metschnikowia pulcherrima]